MKHLVELKQALIDLHNSCAETVEECYAFEDDISQSTDQEVISMSVACGILSEKEAGEVKSN